MVGEVVGILIFLLFLLIILVTLIAVFVRYQYIKILLVRPSVCVCVTDVGVAATNLRFVCKTITCVSAFTKKWPLSFLR